MRTAHCTSALIFAATMVACDSGSPTSPASSLDADLGAVEVITGGLSGYSAAGAGYVGSGGFAPALRAMQPSSCPYNEETQFFTCPSVTSGSYTVVRKFRLLDASGAALSAADPLTLVAIRAVVDVQGNVSGRLLITRHEDNTLSGLQSPTRTLNGTVTQDLTVNDEVGAMLYMTHDVSVTSDLSILNSLDQKYPLGGTIISDGTTMYGPSGASSYSYHREIIFDGSNVMTLKQTFGGNTVMTCRIPMAPSSGAADCTMISSGL